MLRGAMIGDLFDWDGEFLVQRRDSRSGALFCIALHRRRPYPAGGGTRIKRYDTDEEATADACRLATAMSYKLAILDLPRGGGKGVINPPATMDGAGRRALLERYGDLVASLGGAFQTGPDLGSSASDLDVIASRTPGVYGRSPEQGGSGSSGPNTALGVFEGIRACLRHLFCDADPAGRRILVQGAGSVGAPLAVRLATAGAEILVSEPDAGAREALEALWPSPAAPPRWIAPADALTTECDLFAPCAAGGVIDEPAAGTIPCRIVAGAANNPLSGDGAAARLLERGILYAPDFVINGGGAIHLLGREALGWSRAEVEDATRKIGDILAGILETARNRGESPGTVALEAARDRLARRSVGISRGPSSSP